MQKSALKSVNVQRTGKSIFQMFAFSFFDGSHICRFLPILRPPTVPRSHFRYPKTKAFVLIIIRLYLQIITNSKQTVKEQEKLKKEGKCPACRGVGKSPDGQYECTSCKGTGKYP